MPDRFYPPDHPAAGADDPSWLSDPWGKLRRTWSEAPCSARGRIRSEDLLALPDAQLRAAWEAALREQTEGPDGWEKRGWYHALYGNAPWGKKILDVGSGLGFTALSFARTGAHVTFVDLSASNLQLLERLCELLGIIGRFVLLENLASLIPYSLT